ncbi:hypothetical protein [Nostoc sp.]
MWQATTSISTQIKRRSLLSGKLLRSPLFLLRRELSCHKLQQL